MPEGTGAEVAHDIITSGADGIYELDEPGTLCA